MPFFGIHKGHPREGSLFVPPHFPINYARTGDNVVFSKWYFQKSLSKAPKPGRYMSLSLASSLPSLIFVSS